MFIRNAILVLLTVSSFVGAQVEVRLDYLAWKPFGAAILWAQVQEVPGAGTQQITRQSFYLNPDFRSGVRAEIVARSCDTPRFALARYYWVEHKDAARRTNGLNQVLSVEGTVGDSNLLGTSDLGAVGRTRLKQPFHAADIALGYDLCAGSCMEVALMAGGTFLYFDRSLQSFLIASTEGFPPFSTRSRFSGGGPLVGMQAAIPLWRLNVVTEVSVAGLVGKRLNRRQGALGVNSTFNRIINPTITGFATGFFAHVGVSYKTGAFQDTCLGFEFGWEQRAYHDVSAIRLTKGISGGGNNAEEDILFVNMGGPYAGLSLRY